MKQEATLVKKLQEAGMSEGEAHVYYALLASPSMTIQEVTNATKLPRSTVLLALEKFSRTGVIDEYIYGKRRNFVLRSPQMVEHYTDEKLKELEAQKSLLGNLVSEIKQAHFLGSTKGVRIEILKGEVGFKELYNRTLGLRRGEEILRLGVDAKKFFFVPEFLKQYSMEKNKKGIATRLLIPEGEMTRDIQKRDKEDLRQTRLLPKKIYEPDCAIVIWGDSVALTIWDENLETTVISSKRVVDIFRSIFELLWMNAIK